MYIEGANKGVYLSTAKKFSKGSQETAEQLVNNRKFDSFELINYERFCDMLGVVKKDSFKPWAKFVQEK